MRASADCLQKTAAVEKSQADLEAITIKVEEVEAESAGADKGREDTVSVMVPSLSFPAAWLYLECLSQLMYSA